MRNRVRQLGWFFLIAIVALAGACYRQGRRLLRRSPRIWHGTYPLHIVPWHVLADRAAGFPSVAVVDSLKQRLQYLTEGFAYDVVWEERGKPACDWQKWGLVHLLLHG